MLIQSTTFSDRTTGMSAEAALLKTGPLAGLRREWLLGVGFATMALFLSFGKGWLADLSNPLWFALMLVWLFAVIMSAAFAVVHHAESLAVRLGEPLGTLVLTLSVIGIEVMMISAVMLTGEGKPALARDTMFGIVMIVLNGMVGLALLLGGLRHREQQYNLQGANAYLAVIVTLVVLTLILPDFTQTTPGPILSHAQEMVLALVGIGLYGMFLTMQTGRHRGFFNLANEHEEGAGSVVAARLPKPLSRPPPALSHAALLVAYLLPVVFLAEQFARPVDYLIDTVQAPAAIGGVIIAVLVATPEAIGAVRAALANHLQRSVNIFLGSVLATI